MELRKRNKLVFGVGINDADYNVCEFVDGKIVWRCPYYVTWANMLNRCYDESALLRKPTYKGCSVCDEWLIFSNFKKWMEQQDWEGKQLDKDLLVEGNKVYSPETCIFVDAKINKFVIDCGSARGNYMLGVYWDRENSKFKVQCQNPFTGKRQYLGRFDDEVQAHLAWKNFKHDVACQLADSEYCTDERLVEVLCTRYL